MIVSYTKQNPYQPLPKWIASLRSGRLLETAGIALAAIADAEWLNARYPRYELVSISVATPPTAYSARHRSRVPAGLVPGNALMEPSATD